MDLSNFDIGLLSFAVLAGVGVVAYSAYLLYSARRDHEAVLQKALEDFFTILRQSPVEPEHSGDFNAAESTLASKTAKDTGD